MCLLAFCGVAYSRPPVPRTGEPGQIEQQQSAATQQPPPADQRGTEKAPLVVKVLPTPKTDVEASQEAKERDQKASTDWWLIIIGLGQLVVFIGQLFVFGYQAKKLRETVIAAADQSSKMERSIAEATRTAVAIENVANATTASAKSATESVVAVRERTAMQMRAYLTVVVGGGAYQEGEKNIRFAAKPLLVNTGHTPARKVGYRAKAAILPAPLPEDFHFTLPEAQVGASVLGPGQNFILSAIVDDFVADADVAGIKNGTSGRALHVWGTATYEDVFGEMHYTNFCQIITWVPGPQGQTIFGFYSSRHNDAD